MYILRKRQFYFASDASSDSESEEDRKSATTTVVEDKDVGATCKPVDRDDNEAANRETMVMQLSDVVNQL